MDEKTRSILWGTPNTKKKIKQLQGRIKAKNGDAPSITEILEKLVTSSTFEDVEKQLMEKDKKAMEGFGLKFDKKLS